MATGIEETARSKGEKYEIILLVCLVVDNAGLGKDCVTLLHDVCYAKCTFIKVL